MKRFSTILAIALGTFFLMVQDATADSRVSVHPIGSGAGGVNIDIWTDKEEGEIYSPGEPVSVYFYADDDCYVTIYDIDTDGRVRILFPEYPDNGFVYGGMTYRLPDYYKRGSLVVTGPHGIEYIHAVATRTRGIFRYATQRGSYQLNINPIAGDPFLAMNAITRRIIPIEYVEGTATSWFFVGNRVWYPRYMCRSCHGNAISFDPYRDACPRYSVRVANSYDYWWDHRYYPVSSRYRFAAAFWNFEIRTTPIVMHTHNTYVSIAFGYHNYYTPKPPMRPYRHRPMITSRHSVRRDRVKQYHPVTYGHIRDHGRVYPRSTHPKKSTTTRHSTKSRTHDKHKRSRKTNTVTRSTTVTGPGNTTRTTTTRTRTTTIPQNQKPQWNGTSEKKKSSRSRTTETQTTGSRKRSEIVTHTNSTVARPTESISKERTRTTTSNVQTSRIPSASNSEKIPSRTTSAASRSEGNDSRTMQQSSSSSSSRSRTRTR